MASLAAIDRGAITLVRALILTSAVAFVLFLFGFLATAVGFEERTPPIALFLGVGVLSSGLVLILAFWLLFEVDDSTRVGSRGRGRELQSPAIHACEDPILQLDDSLRIVSINPAAERRFKQTLAAANGMPVTFLLAGEPAKSKAAAPKPEAGRAAQPAIAREAKSYVREETPTSARRLAQRTGARLAHLVQPLLGYTELALESLGPDHPVRPDLAEIGRASSRVVLLARSLELFAGAGRQSPVEPLGLNAFLAALEPDLRFVLQPETSLRLVASDEPVVSMANAALIRSAVLLMACNAEEAMPRGSTITICVTPEGLQVADSGEGVPQDVRIAMFKPLVSTKDPERGVGLGLHAARAAMRLQHGDLILTRSEESGTVVTLSLPCYIPAAGLSPGPEVETASGSPSLEAARLR